jgi:outer membrane protein W
MRATHPVILAVALLAVAPGARAQGVGTPVSQADVSGTLGWLSGDKSELESYGGSGDWYNRSLYGGLGFGWYWTDHWKTDIEGGISSSAELQTYSPAMIDGRTVSIRSTYGFATRRLAIGQQYQFYRNVWFHPFAGAGIDLTWEQTERADEIYSSLPVRPGTPYPTHTDLLTRPFATFGFKAYVTPRSFVRTDMKLVFHKGVDEVLLRFGMGVDF